MYPLIRMGLDLVQFRNAPVGILDTHVTTHRILPWDLDMFMELNNGRTLTLYDIGRLTLSRRAGLWRVIRREGWGMTVAGLSVRFRRRVRLFQRVESRTRMVGWDQRFVYMEQSMWRPGGECTSQILARLAVTDRNGIVPPDRVLAAMGQTTASPVLPDWVQNWMTADATRPWPPETVSEASTRAENTLLH